MKKFFLALLPILLFCLLYSCKEKENETVLTDSISKLEVKRQNKIPDSIIDKSIFIHETPEGFARIWVDSKGRKSNYFYSDTLNIFNVARYNFEDGQPEISKKIELYRNEWSYLQIDSASLKKEIIGQDEYLLMTLRPEFMGKAIPDQLILFYLLNLNDIADYSSLSYSGYSDPYCDYCIKGEFAPAENYPKNKKAWQQFQHYAQKSKFISQLKGTEKKLTYFKNYEQKWERDNKTDNHYGAGFGILPDQLYSTYYKEDLFSVNGNLVETSIENDRYIIGTFFRGNLVGYDKKKKLNFPIIVESCAYSCDKKLSFLDEKTIQIMYEGGEKFVIKLDEIIFDD